MCAHGWEIGRGAEDAVHRPTDDESIAAVYDVFWYNSSVILGRRKPILINGNRSALIRGGD